MAMLLSQAATSNPPPSAAEKPNPQSFRTARTLASIEQCLLQELSDLGDPTFMRTLDGTTLMIRNGEGPPLLIDVAPPLVTITTKAPYETRLRVKRCV